MDNTTPDWKHVSDLLETMRAENPTTWELLRNDAAAKLKVFFKSMHKVERLAIVAVLLDGYCNHCGRWLYGSETCHCWNDE